MEHSQHNPGRWPRFIVILKVLLVFVTGLVLISWWIYTPPGLLGKADAAGYAVCHRIEARSFLIGDRAVPLCARCSGMYLGALLGIIYLGRYGKRAGMPVLKVSAVLAFFFLMFGLDGANSYLHFFPNITGLYEPQNWLRLFTGTGLGLGIAAVLVPVVHGAIWQTYEGKPALSGWRAFLPLLALAALLDAILLTENPIVLYPLALLSGASVFLILSMIYGMVWIMITKRENRAGSWRELWLPLTAGFLTALVQIAAFDTVRFWLTGTWGGFNL